MNTAEGAYHIMYLKMTNQIIKSVLFLFSTLKSMHIS